MTIKTGQIVATKNINNEMTKNSDFVEFVLGSLDRYLKCDWGDLCEEDKKMNDSAVKNNDDRIVARYDNIYIITEYDRSVTTILFINEY
jgi:hypothetical protein